MPIPGSLFKGPECLRFKLTEIETEAAIKLSSSSAERYRATPCWLCNADHWNDNCGKYKTAEERKQILNQRCFICLMRGHVAFECLYKKAQSCFYCKRKCHHHRSICPQKFAACQDENEPIKNLNEEPRQLVRDSQNRTNIKEVPEKDLLFNSLNLQAAKKFGSGKCSLATKTIYNQNRIGRI